MAGGDETEPPSPGSPARPEFLALEALESQVPTLAERYQSAEPFPHLVLRDAIRLDPTRAREFPDASWPHWQRFSDGYQTGKATCRDLRVIPSPWRELIEELCAAPFLRFLERVTGIPKLLPDPHLEGGGLHVTGPGGHLRPHTDFHVHEALGLYRRVNALVFLNPDWTPGAGGQLTLHRQDDPHPSVEVTPEWGTCAIFNTSDHSVHGVNPNVGNAPRRSIALYYYTSAPTADFAGDHSTHWRTHARTSIPARVRVGAYRTCMKFSRAFSMLAHLLNPDFGLRAVQEHLKAQRRDSKRQPPA
ncbi:2OG-Fe(II) oxygenase [Myxococcota bacterium]|nr:2OG-Fe(II) oxygenase [Myxococcota bacterium]